MPAGNVRSPLADTHPEWSPDDEQIYYLAADTRIVVVATDRADETSDGQRFLVPSTVGQGRPTVAVVIVSWMSGR